MAKWTEAELLAVANYKTYEDFIRFTDSGKSYDAWEVKRRRVGQIPEVQFWTALRIQQAMKNNVKMARTIIRLRHSLEADDELAVAVPRIKAALEKQAHSGAVDGLSYDELRVLVYGQ